MASSSASSTTNSLSKPSRFSTSLKVFKFSSKDKSPQPPPLPPKDVYYLRNRSLASLSPDSLSVPNSPLSPHSRHSQRLSPDNQSSMSLVSSAASARSYSPADPLPQKPPRPQKKGSGFFKFTRRSPKAQSSKTSPDSDSAPVVPSEDENISSPFNFQHNIHVDEGFAGIPPSWITSLTKDEITTIQNRRRAGARSPSAQPLVSDLPASPAYSLNPPILTRPMPRSTSLPRRFPEGETTLRSPPPLPGTLPSSDSLARVSPPRQTSTSQAPNHHHQPSISTRSVSSSTDSHKSNESISSVQDTAISTMGAPSPSRPIEVAQPTTPPRRTYHITNDISSPPPSYSHFETPPSKHKNGNIHPPDKKDASLFDQSSSSVHSTPRSQPKTGVSFSASPDTTPQKHHPIPESSHERNPSVASSASSSPSQSVPRSRADSRPKRLTALPPRLSLHKADDSTDLSTWGEALLSGISTASADITPNTSTFAAAQDAKLLSTDNGSKSPLSMSTNGLHYERIEASVKRSSPPKTNNQPNQKTKSDRRPPPTRPIPAVSLLNDSDDDEAAPPSSWVEPASTARYDPSLSSWDEPDQSESDHGRPTPSTDVVSPFWRSLEGIVSEESVNREEVYSAALSESCSPTLPFSPDDTPSDRDIIKGQRPVPPGWKEGDDDGKGLLKAHGGGRDGSSNRDSSRSSTSTVTGLVEPAAIVRGASIARMAGAYVIDKTRVNGRGAEQGKEGVGHNARAITSRSSPPAAVSIFDSKHPPSPLSSNFGSEESSAGSGSSSSQSQDHQTPLTEAGVDSPLFYYLESSSSPDPSKVLFSPSPHHRLLVSATDTFGGIKEVEQKGDEEEEEDNLATTTISKPTIVVSDAPPLAPTSIPSGTIPPTPLSPFQRYRGWLSAVVAPLEGFIDEAVDPRDYYLDLHEIAEGDSGSVFAARLTENDRHKLKLPPLVKAQDSDDLANGRTTLIAIKSVAILPSGSPKLTDLEQELSLMKGLGHENILSMDAVYVDLVEDALWIRMELMERSLADIVGLVVHGLMVQDRMIARFASDVLQALEYLHKQNIAHRDVRSDNLLLNSKGILKLTDFSNAVQVTPKSPMRTDPAGVLYWQAPEVRSPPYNALRIDVWSLGATVWEMAEAEPPFAETQQISDRWPPLSQPQLYSPAFHEFLRRCSEPASSRPTPSELRKSPFINNACGRPVIIQLLSQCMAIEQSLREVEASQEPIFE